MKNYLLRLAFVFILILSTNNAIADSSSHQQAANNLMESMNLNQTMISVVEKMVDLEIKKNPQLSLFKDVLRTFFLKYMTGEHLYKAMTTMYMEEFTERELNELANFYKTPTGQKAIQKIPVLTQKGAQWGQKQVSENIEELKAMISKEAKRLEELKNTSSQ